MFSLPQQYPQTFDLPQGSSHPFIRREAQVASNGRNDFYANSSEGDVRSLQGVLPCLHWSVLTKEPMIGRVCFLASMALLVLTAGTFCGRAANVPEISVVASDQSGPAASHGLKKLLAALHSKGIIAEQVTTPEAA